MQGDCTHALRILAILGPTMLLEQWIGVELVYDADMTRPEGCSSTGKSAAGRIQKGPPAGQDRAFMPKGMIPIWTVCHGQDFKMKEVASVHRS